MIALLVGCVVGLVLGLTGAGGSLIAVPLLMLLLAVPVAEASGLALAAVAVSAWVGAIPRIAKGRLAWGPGLVIALSASLVTPVGRWLAQVINEQWLVVGFSLLVVWVAVQMWRQAQTHPDDTYNLRASALIDHEDTRVICRNNPDRPWVLGGRCVVMAALGGLVVGLLSGLFGVGGGFLIVPLLVLLARMPMDFAVSTSLLVIALVSTSGFIVHLNHLADAQAIDLLLLVKLAAGGVAGMFIGGLFSKKLAGPRLQQLFAVFLLLISLLMLVKKFL